MGWYQCRCGFLTEKAPGLGESIVSVYHLHTSARLDGTAAIVRMEGIPEPLPGCEKAIHSDADVAA